MLAQYLLGLMGPGRGVDPLHELFGGMLGGPAGRGMPHGGPEDGRWGDYVFNQQGKLFSQTVE